MIKLEPIIGVQDVEKSSAWYQNILNLRSNHGGQDFEILVNENSDIILCLHKWGEHGHPTLLKPENKDNGLILYFKVDDLESIWENTIKLNVTVDYGLRLNENSGKEDFALRDLDGYYLIISA